MESRRKGVVPCCTTVEAGLMKEAVMFIAKKIGII